MERGEKLSWILVAGRARNIRIPLLKLAPASMVIFMASLLSACFLSGAPFESPADRRSTIPLGLPEGFWQDIDKADYKVAFVGRTLAISYGGRVREIGTVLEATPEGAKVCRFGRENMFSWRRVERSLSFQDVDRQEAHRMIRLRRKPAELEITPFPLGQPVELSQDRISQIQKELFQRHQKDQESLRASGTSRATVSEDLPWLRDRSDQDSGRPSTQTDFQFAETVSENTDYIRRLLSEVGWLDVERFGYATSKSAFLLVQHSWEPPLMLAVLPQLKRDVDAGLMDNDTYALLFDRLQLALGHRQRFGSQVTADETGAVIVLPVEDPSEVDTLRKSIGLIPLKEYVHVFRAPEVKFSPACKALSLQGSQGIRP